MVQTIELVLTDDGATANIDGNNVGLWAGIQATVAKEGFHVVLDGRGADKAKATVDAEAAINKVPTEDNGYL